ncbi:hypothetical protein AX774_g8098 [Zancudomyces culisetae]|uniref:Uncharacterized protein n=1 Tax=Zancudomyces culisetae TaxID=1213189 RepID=A0A1R1PCC0_ZANCU|nr:hypothetical protein AX774_g8098 [Zancudomyces culisetae]|eukprot:OMH78502.1 hypothetical protein AX774_g8098 [Zancudomyces culisetae]
MEEDTEGIYFKNEESSRGNGAGNGSSNGNGNTGYNDYQYNYARNNNGYRREERGKKEYQYESEEYNTSDYDDETGLAIYDEIEGQEEEEEGDLIAGLALHQGYNGESEGSSYRQGFGYRDGDGDKNGGIGDKSQKRVKEGGKNDGLGEFRLGYLNKKITPPLEKSKSKSRSKSKSKAGEYEEEGDYEQENEHTDSSDNFMEPQYPNMYSQRSSFSYSSSGMQRSMQALDIFGEYKGNNRPESGRYGEYSSSSMSFTNLINQASAMRTQKSGYGRNFGKGAGAGAGGRRGKGGWSQEDEGAYGYNTDVYGRGGGIGGIEEEGMGDGEKEYPGWSDVTLIPISKEEIISIFEDLQSSLGFQVDSMRNICDADKAGDDRRDGCVCAADCALWYVVGVYVYTSQLPQCFVGSVFHVVKVWKGSEIRRKDWHCQAEQQCVQGSAEPVFAGFFVFQDIFGNECGDYVGLGNCSSWKVVSTAAGTCQPIGAGVVFGFDFVLFGYVFMVLANQHGIFGVYICWPGWGSNDIPANEQSAQWNSQADIYKAAGNE